MQQRICDLISGAARHHRRLLPHLFARSASAARTGDAHRLRRTRPGRRASLVLYADVKAGRSRQRFADDAAGRDALGGSSRRSGRADETQPRSFFVAAPPRRCASLAAGKIAKPRPESKPGTKGAGDGVSRTPASTTAPPRSEQSPCRSLVISGTKRSLASRSPAVAVKTEERRRSSSVPRRHARAGASPRNAVQHDRKGAGGRRYRGRADRSKAHGCTHCSGRVRVAGWCRTAYGWGRTGVRLADQSRLALARRAAVATTASRTIRAAEIPMKLVNGSTSAFSWTRHSTGSRRR